MSAHDTNAELQVRRLLRRGYALPLLLLGIAAGLLTWGYEQVQANAALVARTDQIIQRAVLCLKLAVDMETGVRGYQLTGDSRLLEPYRYGGARIESEFNEIERLILVERQRKLLAAARAAHAEWAQYGRELIRRRDSAEDYGSIGVNIKGKDLFDQLRSSFEEFLAGEESLRAERADKYSTRSRLLLWVRIGMLLLAGCGLAWFTRNALAEVRGLFVTSERAAREEAEKARAAAKELEVLNRSLDQRVTVATRSLEETNAELQNFVHTVSHDLRAPMRAIEGYASVLAQEWQRLPAEECKRIASAIERRATDLQVLVEQLLEYARLGNAKAPLEAVGLMDVLRDARDYVASEIAQRRADVVLPVEAPTVLAYRPVLTLALVNLLSNAIKFVPAQRAPAVRVLIEQKENRVRIALMDNGTGIAAADQARLFQPFERMHLGNDFPGSGLGLAIVKRALHKMGGEVGVTSTMGEGSTFWVQLAKAPNSPD